MAGVAGAGVTTAVINGSKLAYDVGGSASQEVSCKIQAPADVQWHVTRYTLSRSLTPDATRMRLQAKAARLVYDRILPDRRVCLCLRLRPTAKTTV